jgi:hypothetical protein
MKRVIYLAGPLFSLAEREFNRSLAAGLRNWPSDSEIKHYEVFLPQEHPQGDAPAGEIFHRDKQELKNAESSESHSRIRRTSGALPLALSPPLACSWAIKPRNSSRSVAWRSCMSRKAACAETSAGERRTLPAILAMCSAGASFDEEARAEARAEIWAIVMEVRRRRDHFQADASVFFHAFVPSLRRRAYAACRRAASWRRLKSPVTSPRRCSFLFASAA